jgi:hypothetical protein
MMCLILFHSIVFARETGMEQNLFIVLHGCADADVIPDMIFAHRITWHNDKEKA